MEDKEQRTKERQFKSWADVNNAPFIYIALCI